VFSPAVILSFIFTGCYAEFMKGGMLMKSKHIATYGKEIACCNFSCYHFLDNLRYKRTIAAFEPPKTAIDF